MTENVFTKSLTKKLSSLTVDIFHLKNILRLLRIMLKATLHTLCQRYN